MGDGCREPVRGISVYCKSVISNSSRTSDTSDPLILIKKVPQKEASGVANDFDQQQPPCVDSLA